MKRALPLVIAFLAACSSAGARTASEITVAAAASLSVAAAGVPAGDYAREALVRGGLRPALGNIVSNEQDVEGVVQKVVSGDADAGIAYATDVTPAVVRAVTEIELPATTNVVAVYEIGVIHGTKASSLARAFFDYVLGPGQA